MEEESQASRTKCNKHLCLNKSRVIIKRELYSRSIKNSEKVRKNFVSNFETRSKYKI